MTNYRRTYTPGAIWFATVNSAGRKGNQLLEENIDCLRNAFDIVRTRHPFRIDGGVILPDHLQCIWTLPSNDNDFSKRWGLIKTTFSCSIEKGEQISASRQNEGNEDYGSAALGNT